MVSNTPRNRYVFVKIKFKNRNYINIESFFMTKLLTTDDFVYPLFCYLPLILCDFRVLKLQNKGPTVVEKLIILWSSCHKFETWKGFYNFTSQAVGWDLWLQRTLKSIMWEILFLDQLHIYCYYSQIHFYTFFLKSKVREKIHNTKINSFLMGDFECVKNGYRPSYKIFFQGS